jgi:hypothetical protein
MLSYSLFAFGRENHPFPIERDSIMSQAEPSAPAPNAASKNVPDGLAKGILGFVLGAGVTFLGMHFYGPREEVVQSPPPANMVMPTNPGGPAGGSGPAPGDNSTAAQFKGTLSAFVGKLELLSRDNFALHLEFDKDQAAEIAAQLSALQAAKTLTAEEAGARLEKLQATLTPAQKSIVDGIDFHRPADGGGPPMAAAAIDENPFAQEANEKRLKDLLARLKPADDSESKPADQ